MSVDLEIKGTTTITFANLPMFPSSVIVGGVTILLHADGTWEGDKDAFIAACKAQKQDASGTTMPIIWLIANAINR